MRLGESCSAVAGHDRMSAFHDRATPEIGPADPARDPGPLARRAGQSPRSGTTTEERTDLGFKVRVPQKWESIPPAPNDGNLVIMYDPRTNKAVQLGKRGLLPLAVWVLKFDRRKPAATETAPAGTQTIVESAKDLDDWVKNLTWHDVHWKGFQTILQKSVQVDKIDAIETTYLNTETSRDGDEIRMFSTLYKLTRRRRRVRRLGPRRQALEQVRETAFRGDGGSFKRPRREGEGVDPRGGRACATEAPSSRARPAHARLEALRDAELLHPLRQPRQGLPRGAHAPPPESIRAIYEQDYPAEEGEGAPRRDPSTTTGAAAVSRTTASPPATTRTTKSDEGEKKDDQDQAKPKPRSRPSRTSRSRRSSRGAASSACARTKASTTPTAALRWRPGTGTRTRTSS